MFGWSLHKMFKIIQLLVLVLALLCFLKLKHIDANPDCKNPNNAENNDSLCSDSDPVGDGCITNQAIHRIKRSNTNDRNNKNGNQPKRALPGGVQKLKGQDFIDARNTLRKSLRKLAAGNGPRYTIVKIHSASYQLVQGDLYRYRVDLRGPVNKRKPCNVSIWSQSWVENGTEVTFKCKGEARVVRRY